MELTGWQKGVPRAELKLPIKREQDDGFKAPRTPYCRWLGSPRSNLRDLDMQARVVRTTQRVPSGCQVARGVVKAGYKTENMLIIIRDKS